MSDKLPPLMPPRDRHGRQIEVDRNVYLQHNNKVCKVVYITRSEGGNCDQWIIGCDSGEAFLLPHTQDNVTLLRECPFCGCSEPIVETDEGNPKSAWVTCPDCEAKGPTEAIPDGMMVEEAAVEAWNDANWRKP